MRALAALCISSPLWAQAISVGLRTGIPITASINAQPPVESSASWFQIGHLIEFNLGHGAGLGAEFLVRRTGLSIPRVQAGRAFVWQFEVPGTIVYRFRPAGPFVRAGVSVNRVFIAGAAECGRGPSGEVFYCLNDVPLAELRHRTTLGFVAGAGVRFKVRTLSIEPEVRLTRWVDRNLGVRESGARSNLTQAAFLVGVFF
jgi:hypothetical protein